ncbi:MAG TPA: histidine phosphatase family protein [Vitreimonas sp.]|uniref:histidine phosphatase family protein n=1 Tax=Vitreimonas sp. TaxID=3069702 RepID=UPI002D494CCF|nr:histidine phosphatase family protein [Vitreimonas sp.]HYD87420.1 histidine phosphatase family protein [Vitreimonas sp.]
MARLFLIRHGEPEAAWGSADDDPGLSSSGRAQAEAAAQALLAEGALAAFTSPMRRCRETAASYERLAGVRAAIEPRVSEVPTPAGVSDRRTWLQQNFPWRGGAPRTWSALDEALHAWRREMLACIRAFERDTAVFTHFIAVNVIAGAALGREDTIVCKPGYASITEIEVSPGGLRLVRFGDEMQTGEVR